MPGSAGTPNLSRLILYEPGGGGDGDPTDVRDRLEALIAADDREGALVLVFREVAGLSDKEIGQVRSSPTWPVRLAAVHTVPRELQAEEDYAFTPARYAEMEVPTLLLIGETSPPWARPATGAVAAALANATVRPLVGQGHAANMTAPDLLASEILAFLS